MEPIWLETEKRSTALANLLKVAWETEGEANWGKKVYRRVDAEGKAWEQIKSWFSFRLHLIVEADSEMPIAYQVTQASMGEPPIMRQMMEQLDQTHSELISRCEKSNR